MSILANGVSFDLGNGWLYAPESATTAFEPGTFSSNPLFLTDKNGNPFQSGIEYRFFAKHPILDPEPLLYGFKDPGDGSVIFPYQIPTTTGGATGGTVGGSSGNDTLDDVTARTTYTDSIDSDFLASYQPHPVKSGKVLIRAFGFEAIWYKLLGVWNDTIRGLFIDKLNLKLSELKEMNTSANIVSQNQGNFVTNLNTGQGEQRGHFVLYQGLVQYFSGWFPDGFVGISDSAGRRIGFKGEDIVTTAKRILFNGLGVEFKSARLIVNTSSRMVLQSGDPTSIIGVYGPKPATEGYDDVVYTKSQVANWLFPEIYPLIVAAGSAITGGVDAIHQGEAIGCVDEAEPGLLDQFFTITHFQFGTPITHGLKVGGANIFPFVLGPDNQDAIELVDLSFDGTTSFTVTPRDASVAADADYYVKIRLLRTI